MRIAGTQQPPEQQHFLPDELTEAEMLTRAASALTQSVSGGVTAAPPPSNIAPYSGLSAVCYTRPYKQRQSYDRLAAALASLNGTSANARPPSDPTSTSAFDDANLTAASLLSARFTTSAYWLVCAPYSNAAGCSASLTKADIWRGDASFLVS